MSQDITNMSIEEINQYLISREKEDQINKEKLAKDALEAMDSTIATAKETYKNEVMALGFPDPWAEAEKTSQESGENDEKRKQQGYITNEFRDYIIEHGKPSKGEWPADKDHIIELYQAHKKLKGKDLNKREIKNTLNHSRYVNKKSVQFLPKE